MVLREHVFAAWSRALVAALVETEPVVDRTGRRFRHLAKEEQKTTLRVEIGLSRALFLQLHCSCVLIDVRHGVVHHLASFQLIHPLGGRTVDPPSSETVPILKSRTIVVYAALTRKISRFGFEYYANQRWQAPKDVFSKHIAHSRRRFADRGPWRGPLASLACCWDRIASVMATERPTQQTPPLSDCAC